MRNLKKLTLTLVALFAMTTGAWAQTVVNIGTMCPPDETTMEYNGDTWQWVQCNPAITNGYVDVKLVNGALKNDNTTPTVTQLIHAFTICNLMIIGEQGKVSTVQLLNANGEKVKEVSVNKELKWDGNNISIAPADLLAGAMAENYIIRVNLSEFSFAVPLDDTKTSASFPMPAYDATVSYELVRDLAQGVAFSGLPEGDGCILKKDGDKYTFATAPTIALEDNISGTAQAITAEGITLSYEKKGEGDTWVAQPDDFDIAIDAVPGTYRVVAKATTGLYDGTLYSPEFTLAEAYDLTLSPATDANLQSVTVAGTAKTADENGVIRGIEPTKKVKITTTGPDYIIRKATVKKGGASGVLTGVINLDNLKEGDIMKDITGFTGNYVCITLKEGRYKEAGFTRDIPQSLVIPNITFNANGYTLTVDMDYTPVDEKGQDGNAWIFLGIQSGDPVFGGYTLK